VDPATLTERVNAVYARSDPPSWPNPHQDREAGDDEYSRVTDPTRYDVVAQRARAWVRVLGSLPDIDAEPVAPKSVGPRFDRGVRLTSRETGTLPLLILEHDSTGAEDVPMVCVSLVEPEIEMGRVPDCGCDACDLGSADVVSGLDETIIEALNGLVLMLGTNWRGTWTPDGGGVGGGPGLPEFDQVMDWGRRIAGGETVAFPEEVRVLVNRPWM
jgi:hypothetical protein